MTSFAVKYPRVASYGHTVSHAKNRRARAFKYNLCTVTIQDDQTGKKVKMRVPAKVIRTLKKHGLKKSAKK
jgi:ribosomal protein L28